MNRLLVILGLGVVLLGPQALGCPTPVAGPRSFKSDDAFVDYIERQTFNYFWEEANPTNGLVRDRSSANAPCSIAAVGFGLSAINIAIERGWIERTNGDARVLRTLRTLWTLPQGPSPTGCGGYHGWFYHFLDMETGLRAPRSELSSMDTALLMMGVIDAGQFFHNPTNQVESQIRELSAALLQRIDWPFMIQPGEQVVDMEWTPETGYGPARWVGYNEGACLYLLGLGRAQDPLPLALWNGWTRGYRWQVCYGQSLVAEPPLFTHQYSHVWIDFRGIADAYMRGRKTSYFENSRLATLAQRGYGIENPLRFPNYGTNEWGLTACDGPDRIVDGVRYAGYRARGAPAGFDDGTIAPTAAASSLPFAPVACLTALRHLYDTYSADLWTTEGFRDAYNVRAHWFARDLVGIDQGPMVLMLENYRTGSTWSRMLSSPVIQRGLERAGFTAPPPDRLTVKPLGDARAELSWRDESAYETGFMVESSTDNKDFTLAAALEANATRVSLPTAARQNYFFRVRTASAAGVSGYRETVAFSPGTLAKLGHSEAGEPIQPGNASSLATKDTLSLSND